MRIHIPIPLRWADLDAYNHVNNVEMMRLLEEARVRAFWIREDGSGENLPSAVLKASVGADTFTLIARHEVEYLKPLAYQRQPVDVQLWISRIGAASAEVCYEVYGANLATPYARSSSTMVFIDVASQRPRRINERERSAWAPYIEDPVVFGRRYK